MRAYEVPGMAQSRLCDRGGWAWPTAEEGQAEQGYREGEGHGQERAEEGTSQPPQVIGLNLVNAKLANEEKTPTCTHHPTQASVLILSVRKSEASSLSWFN